MTEDCYEATRPREACEGVPDKFIERLRETVKYADGTAGTVRSRLARYNPVIEEAACCDTRLVDRNCGSEFFRQCFDLVEQIREQVAAIAREFAESEV